MLKRTCPNCLEALTDFDNFFCTYCGKKVSPDLVLSPPALKVKTYKLSTLTLGTRLRGMFRSKSNSSNTDIGLATLKPLSKEQIPHNKMTYVLFYILIAFGVGFLAIYIKTNFLYSYKDKEVQEAQKIFANTVDLGLDFESNVFGSDFITDYIPQQSILYIESHDSHAFVKELVNNNSFNANLIKGASELVHKHFVMFAYEINNKVEWGFVFIPKDIEVVSAITKEYALPKWHLAMVEENLIIASSVEIFDIIKNAKAESIPNISLNANYVKSIGNVQRSGQVLVILLSREKALSALAQLESMNIKPAMQDLVKYVIEAGFSEFVVDNIKGK